MGRGHSGGTCLDNTSSPGLAQMCDKVLLGRSFPLKMNARCLWALGHLCPWQVTGAGSLCHSEMPIC